MVEILDRNYRDRNIYILSHSQAAIKALNNYQITSKLAWDCHQSIMQQAKYNRYGCRVMRPFLVMKQQISWPH
jgi:hypothetical protein